MDRLLALASAAALLCTLLSELLPPLGCSGHCVSAFALLTLLLLALQWIRLRADWLSALLLLPALPLALVLEAREGAAAGAQALSALALATAGRLLLLRIAAERGNESLRLAAALETRLPGSAHVFVDQDIESDVAPASVREGHILRVAPNESIPADGIVTFGSSFVDESLGLSSESPRVKGMGSPVFAGTLNKNGTLLLRASAAGESTLVARLARRAREGARDLPVGRWRWTDAILTAATSLLFALGGLWPAFHALLLGSCASFLALAALFASRLSTLSAGQGWWWAPGGLLRLAKAGILATRAEGVFTEGRSRLAALEIGGLSEDAILRFLGPLARKLETAEAFAILLELRTRNIPLEQADFFEHSPGGGTILLQGESARWLDLPTAIAEKRALGAFEPFVQAQSAAGNTLCFLDRDGTLCAALAFQDAPVEGAPAAAELLASRGLPMVLVSPLPKAAAERQRSQFQPAHVHAEAGETEMETLVARLAQERMRPAWIQVNDGFRPHLALVVASGIRAEGADLALFRTDLASLAVPLLFARSAAGRLRAAASWLYGAQAGLLLTVASSSPRIAPWLHLGQGWSVSSLAVAAAGLLPAFVALAAVFPPLPEK